MSGPAKILHVVNGLDAGGTETLLLLAARHRDRDRFAFQVAYLLPGATALRATLEAEDVETTCLGRNRPWDLRWLPRLRRQLLADPVELVHAHSPLVATGVRLVLATMARGDRPKLVVTLHNMWASHHPAVRAVDRLTHQRDDRRLTVSDAVRGSLPGRSGRGAVTVIHGVDRDRLLAEADRGGVRRELGVSEHQILIGTVGNLRSNKGYPDLIDAASAVVAADDRVRFVVVGQGARRAELEARRDARRLGERFRFLGYRPDATRLVSGFDVFVLASHVEGLPLALMEALVLGVPVVVTDVGGVAELVTDGEEGRLVPAGRPAQLAAALLAMVDSADRRAEHACRAAARGTSIEARRAVRSVEAHYLRLLAPEPAPPGR